MAKFTGINQDETITPGFVSISVIVSPLGAVPSAVADQLYGFGGNDILDGGDGNDTLDGGTGADTMTGGLGSDTYFVDNAGDVITPEAANGGTADTVVSTRTYTLAANLEILNLTGTIAINGTGNASDNTIVGNSNKNVLTGGAGNDILNGNGGDDTLKGGAGNDRLDGGSGSDTMDGGLGDDMYIVDNLNDVATEAPTGSGTDTVQSLVTYTLSANIENLTLLGPKPSDGTGNARINVINGNSGANTLSGMDGNDTLKGFGANDTLLGGNGNDILDGGLGVDTMDGGLGDDTHIVDNTSDVAEETATGGGVDLVQSSVAYTLSAELENLTLTGAALYGTGNAKNNVIEGNDKDNAMGGLEGNDTLRGNGGKDQLGGGPGDDTLEGGTGDDELSGGDGNDILKGGTGTDTLNGGPGNDTYIIEFNGGGGPDAIIEAPEGGVDAVESATFPGDLPANVENVTLLGTLDLSVDGNSGDNIITGNSGDNNLFTGPGGADTLIGLAGDDTLRGDGQSSEGWLGR